VYGGINDSTNVMDANGVSQYDGLNRPAMWEQTATVNGTHDSFVGRSHFAFDNVSRLTGSWRDEQAGKGEWYGYQVTGQLTGVAYNADQVWTGAPQNATRSVSYTMTPDTLNRSTMNDTPDQSGAGGDLSVYTPNALNQYTDINGGGLYYDENFNLMWTGGFSAGYDADKRLTAIGSGEDYGQFVYDGLGRCLKRTIDGDTTRIVYDGWKPIWEFDQWNGVSWNIYGPGPDEILYRHDTSRGELRYHLDRMGNIAFLLDSDGDGIERYTYDAFGHPTVTDWDGNNPRSYSWYGNRFMFTGQEYFPELGLYDYRNRFYYPTLGRFLQTDPMGLQTEGEKLSAGQKALFSPGGVAPQAFSGSEMNLFRYCGDDPVDRSDPLGLSPEATRDFENAVDKYKAIRPDAKGVGADVIGKALFGDANDAAKKSADAIVTREGHHTSEERAYGEYSKDGKTLVRQGPTIGVHKDGLPQADVPGPPSGLPSKTAPVTSSHSHVPGSMPWPERGDVPTANGHNPTGKPIIISVGATGDRGANVRIYVPTGNGHGETFHTFDGVDFERGY
jgi:RHS repeat-associated protein